MEKHELIQKKIENCKKELAKNKYVKLFGEKGENLNNEDFLFIKYVLEQSTEFTAYQRGDLEIWDITTNPNYETSKSVISTNRIQKGTLIFTSILIIIGTIIQYCSWKVSKDNLRLLESQQYQDSIYIDHKRKTMHELELKVISIQKKVDSLRK